MSHVFVSYKREDETRVGRIARALEKSGLEVWWDRGLPSGENWHANIEANLDSAGCVVLVWSQGSIAPEGHFVRDEARRGLARGILVPVLIDRIKAIPLGFGEIQTIDLTHWKGDLHDPFFQDLVAAVRAKLDGAPAPKPRGPTARVARRLVYGGMSTAGAAAVASFALNTFGVAARLCVTPGLQPGLSDACGAAGLGDRPSRAERLAWAARPAGSCPALRDHVARFPAGAYHRQAADMLTARKVTYQDAWARQSRSLALFSPADGPGAPSEAAAKARALARAQGDAERLCRAFGAGTLFRFVSAAPSAEKWACAASASGTVCGFEGEAVCALDEHHSVEHESCGPAA
jgi:hypothetical protein